MTELRVSATPHQAGDAAVVNRGGVPAAVVLGTGATRNVGIGPNELVARDAQGQISGVVEATDGREVELGVSATHLRWRYVGAAEWADLLALAAVTGADGREVEFQTSATHVQLRYTGQTAWTDLVALSSLAGADGREIELGASATHVQWRYVGATGWTDLIPLSSLAGPATRLELGVSETHIRWRQVGAPTWENLIALAALSGEGNGLTIPQIVAGLNELTGSDRIAVEAVRDAARHVRSVAWGASAARSLLPTDDQASIEAPAGGVLTVQPDAAQAYSDGHMTLIYGVDGYTIAPGAGVTFLGTDGEPIVEPTGIRQAFLTKITGTSRWLVNTTADGIADAARRMRPVAWGGVAARDLVADDDAGFALSPTGGTLTIQAQTAGQYPEGMSFMVYGEGGFTLALEAPATFFGLGADPVTIEAGLRSAAFVRVAPDSWLLLPGGGSGGEALSVPAIVAGLGALPEGERKALIRALGGMVLADGFEDGDVPIYDATGQQFLPDAGLNVSPDPAPIIAGAENVILTAEGDAAAHAPVAIASTSGPVEVSFAASLVRTVQPTGNITISAVTGLPEHQRGLIVIRQGATPYSVAFAAGFVMPEDFAYTAAANTRLVIGVMRIAGETYLLPSERLEII